MVRVLAQRRRGRGGERRDRGQATGSARCDSAGLALAEVGAEALEEGVALALFFAEGGDDGGGAEVGEFVEVVA